MEIHTGDRKHLEKPSKTEVLFVSAPARTYVNPSTFDETDLSDIDLGDDKFFPVADKFCYLGSVITRNCREDGDVCHRIKRAGNAY